MASSARHITKAGAARRPAPAAWHARIAPVLLAARRGLQAPSRSCEPLPLAAARPQAKCHFFKNDDFDQVLTELPAKGSVAKTKSELALVATGALVGASWLLRCIHKRPAPLPALIGGPGNALGC